MIRLIKEKIKYIELSACKEFNDFFIDAMLFTEEQSTQ
ncbi:ATP-binding protein [Lucifera butyrica]|nr:ATP-binding protein [Lucifera butyrica]